MLEPEGDGATAAVVTFAMLQSVQWGVPESTPVWVVSLEGACVPEFGNSEAVDKPACAGTELNVVIDPTSGQFEFAYSYR